MLFSITETCADDSFQILFALFVLFVDSQVPVRKIKRRIVARCAFIFLNRIWFYSPSNDLPVTLSTADFV